MDRQQDVLRLQPEMIPSLRAAFGAAVDRIESALVELSRNGYLRTPWLGDEISLEIATYYADRAMTAPDSSYNALVAYRNELTQVHHTLQRMEDEYRRADVFPDPRA